MSNLEPLNDEAYFNDATEGTLAKEIEGFSSTATPAELNCVNQTLLTKGL